MNDKPKRIEVTAAKGRPMLSWVGKKPLRHVPSLPAQHIETFDPSGDLAKIKPRTTWLDWPTEYPKSGLLFYGDNKEVLAHLLANDFRNRVNMIYIDPPFDSAADYVRKVELRGVKGKAAFDGEGYSLGEQIQYSDIWANDTYLQFMYERLLLLKELLATNGSLFVHVDTRRAHHMQCLLDEIFGSATFQNAISWKRTPFAGSSKARAHRYPANHDVLLFYTKTDDFLFQHDYAEYSENYIRRFKNPDDDPRGPYRLTLLKSYSKERFEQWKEEGRLVPPKKDGAYWSYKQYLSESKGVQADDFWEGLAADGLSEEELVSHGTMWGDINLDNPMSNTRTDYPTQKPEDLIARLVKCTTNPGDIVLDCFIGSGTTAAVAQKTGRRWIGCDINKGAIQTTSKRLQAIIGLQVSQDNNPQRKLDGMEDAPNPTQLSLCVYRVNDYDLQVQHNEAVALACDYIGVETSRSDTYFDGTLGKALVKIIPFNHPLSPVDLEDLKQELETRKDEDRDITLVCLGMEIACQARVDEWNRLRKKSDNIPNRIRVIELRTDPNYAGFLKHDPAIAKVKISRDKSNGTVKVVVEDFISPTIIKRLDMEQGLFQKKVKDWRSMVDCIMIDPSYDGEIFNVFISDVPEKKNDLVSGEYEVEASNDKATVAVKIIDMLGEEVLITKEV